MSNSDEGSGYQKRDFESLCGEVLCHDHFMDRYHVNMKIKERLKFVPELVKDFQQAVYAYYFDSLVPLYETLESLCETPESEGGPELTSSAIGAHLSLSSNVSFSRSQRPSLALVRVTSIVTLSEMKEQGQRWREASVQAIVKLLSARRNQNCNAYTDYDSLPEVEAPAYDWHHLFKSYRKPTSELKKVMKWDYTSLYQAHLGPHKIRRSFNI